MRSALLPLLVIVALLVTSLGAAAQSADTDTATDDEPMADQVPVDQDSPDSTPTPAVVYLVVTATPVPTAAPTDTPVTYTTRNGQKSEQDLRRELVQAGYQGPWDLGALLTAYDRASAPTPTPVPTKTPMSAPARATLDPALASRCFQFAFDVMAMVAATAAPGHGADLAQATVAIQNGCQQAAAERGSSGESCYEFAITRSFQAAIQGAGASSLVDALYRGCLGGWSG